MGVTTSGGPGRSRQRTFTRIDPAVASTVPLARCAIVDFAREAGAQPETLESIRLAVSEAITNAVLHGYLGAAGRVYSSVWLAAGRLEVHIADDGHGLNGGSRHAGLGLGLALIAQVSDGFEVVDRASGGTEVRMRFDLA